MTHPLYSRIQDVARRARRLELVHGGCLFGAAVIAAAISLGLADYFIRFRDPGVRLITSLTFLAVVFLAFLRFLRPLFHPHHKDVAVAQLVEQRFPQFRDRLSSSIQFLTASGGAAQLGSVTLQQAVISEAEKLAASVDLTDCLSSRATRRAVAVVLPVFLLGGVLFAADRDSSLLALRRLVMPLSSESWPRWNQLAFKDAPRRLAAGQDFEVVLQDINGRLPAQAVIRLWFEGDSPDAIESRRIRRARHRLSYRRANVTRAFRYRAVGGDDDTMEWISLEVVDPPSVEDLSIQIHPPAYSGLGATNVNGGSITALQGSTIEVVGRASRRISVAELRVEGVEAPFGLPIEIGSDGMSFLMNTKQLDDVGSGRYWLKIEEADGVIGGHDTQASWQVIADAPPSVTIESPAANEVFTSQAIVPLRLQVMDELAIKSVALKFRGQNIPLYEGPNDAPTRASLTESPDKREVVYSWDLRRLNLKPHDLFEFSIEAIDYKGQTQSSPLVRLSLIDLEDFEYVLQQRQARLRERLSEALRTQHTIRGRLAALSLQQQNVSVLADRDRALLQGCELQQRQVQRLLGPDADGAEQLASTLIASIRNNRVDQSEMFAKLSDIASQLGALNRDVLPLIQDDLVRSAQAAEVDSAQPTSLTEPLARAQKNQDAVIESLRSMVSLLSSWDDFRRFARDVGTLLQSEQGLSRRVNELRTLGRRWDELSAAQQSDLLQLSAEQHEILKQAERLFGEMNHFTQQPSHSSSEAETVTSALQAAGEHAVVERMQQGRATLARNQLGNARQALRESTSGLEAVLAILSGRVTDDKLAEARQLDIVGKQIDQLVDDQQKLRQRLDNLDESSEAARTVAAREQSEVASRANEMASALRKLGRREVADLLALGSAAAERAGTSAQAGRDADATAAARDAETRFSEASQQVKGQLRETRKNLLDKTAARLLRTVAELVIWQHDVHHQFVSQQAKLRQTDGAELLRRIAADQLAIADHTKTSVEQLQPPQAFALAMSWSERSMRQAYDRMSAGLVDEETTAAQLDALKKLETLLKSLQPGEQSDGAGDGTANTSNGEGNPAGSKYSVAELQALLGMQRDIQDRTVAIGSKIVNHVEGAPQIEAGRERLAADQRVLSEIVGELAQKTEADEPPDSAAIDDLDQALQDAIDELPPQDRQAGDFDERLLEGLGASPEEPAGEDLGQRQDNDPLADIGRRMQHASQRVERDPSLELAIHLQDEIIQDLEELARQADQQSSQQPSSGAPKPSQGGDGPTTQGTASSSGSTSPSEDVEAVWRGLPENLRQQIGSPVNEEFLPQYERIIQEYYKRLAEDRRERSGQ